MKSTQLNTEFEGDTGVAGVRPAGSFDIWHYLAVLRRRWWLIVSTTALAFGMAWWSQRSDLPEYTAETLLQQLPDQAAVSPWGFMFDANMGSHLDIMRSAEVLTPVVDSLGLQMRLRNHQNRRSAIIGRFMADRAVAQSSYELERQGTDLVLTHQRTGRELARGLAGSSLEGPGFTLQVDDASEIVEPLEFRVVNFDVATESLERRLRIESGTGPDLIWIRFSDPDPQHASDVVNSVALAYQLHRAQSARETAERRRSFVAVQLGDMADSLHASQQNVIDYQTETLYDPNTEGSAVVAELLAMDANLRELRYQESLLSGLVAGLQTSGENDQALQQIMALGADLVPQGPQLSLRLQELQLRRLELTASRFGATAQDPQVQVVDSLIVETKVQARLAAEQSLQILRNRIRQDEIRYGQLSGRAGSLPVRTAEYSRLQQRVVAIQGIFDQLVARYFEAQIAEGVEVGDIDVVAPAAVPVWPDPTYHTMNLVIGVMAGLLLGLVGALMIDQTDSRVRRSADVTDATNLEVVGTIPNIRGLAMGSPSVEIGKDAFRALRTHLRFASMRDQPKLIAVTSATPRDGKSTVASNLALTLADQGSRVLLIDADLRRPQIHTTFDLEQAPGVSDVLMGLASIDEAIRELPEHRTLNVLASGTGVEQPTELIGNVSFEELLAELRSRYEYIVIDTPPLLAVTDAALVGAVADGTLIVVRANKTDSGALQTAVSQLRRLRVPLLGVVMNGVPTGRSSGYSYYAEYYPSYAAGAAEVPEAEQKRPLLRSGRRQKVG